MPRVIEKSISFDVKRNEGQKCHIDSQRHLAVMQLLLHGAECSMDNSFQVSHFLQLILLAFRQENSKTAAKYETRGKYLPISNMSRASLLNFLL